MTFIAKQDAENWLRARHTDVARAGEAWPKLLDSAKPTLTLDGYATGWIDRRQVNGHELAAWTRTRYLYLLKKHISPTFGSMLLTSITPDAVQQWYASLAADRKTTRAHVYSLMRTLLSSAVRERLITENPAAIEGAGTVKRRHQVRIASLDELAAIVANMPERLRLSVLLAAWCSLRYGEVAELRRSDVLVSEDGTGILCIRRGVTWPESATKPLVGPPKTEAGMRDVAVPPHIVPALKVHLATHTQWGRDGLLFPSRSGNQIHAAAFFKPYSRARAAAGRSDLRFHDLRHTGATMAAQSGATLAELMNRLGHTTPAAALIYQHVGSGRDQQIAARLSEMATGTSWS